jgi:sugar lactone lactonase YvrE
MLAMASVALAAFVCLALTIPFDRILKWGPLVYFLRNGYMRGPTFAYDAAPLSSVRVGLAILAVLALHLALQRPLPQRHRLTAALLSFAFFVTAGVDVIHIWDRMNTVFKFYLESWFVFSVAAAAAAFELWYGMAASRTRALWKAAVVAAFTVAVFTAATATFGVITTKRVRTPRPTLDGTAYLPLRDPQEAAAFEWLNSEIGGIPVIAEAYGPSYQDYARVSMNTGLPTVLGWDYHVHQRAHAWPDINRRKADLKTLYTTDSKDVARKILDNYHVALLYVGKIERREYGGGNIANFREWDDVVLPVYENDGVTIFAVQGQFTGATEMQTIEHVPEVQSEGGGGEEAQIQAEQGRLTQPRGVAVDPQGNVYVADFGNHRIQKFDPNFVFVTGWGTQGDLPGEFKQPGDVAVDAAGNVYVADTWNQRVQVFSSTGEYVREIGGAFFGPRGIAVTGDGRVYLVDTGNHRIRRFDAKGIEEKNWGGLGSETGQFKEPVGIAVDKEGNVYVCDNGNERVEIFDADGNFKREFHVDGWEMKVFSEPHIAVAADGTIWLTVPTQRSVRAYDQDGKLLREIVGAEAPGAVFSRPMGIALLPGQQELVVTDLEGRLVKVPAQLK